MLRHGNLQAWKSSKEPGELSGDDDISICRVRVSYGLGRVNMGDAARTICSPEEPEMTTTRFRRSVARRLDCELAKALRPTLEVVMDGSVTAALSSLGLLLSEFLGDESLLCICTRLASAD